MRNGDGRILATAVTCVARCSSSSAHCLHMKAFIKAVHIAPFVTQFSVANPISGGF
jgi:hypothetical protein